MRQLILPLLAALLVIVGHLGVTYTASMDTSAVGQTISPAVDEDESLGRKPVNVSWVPVPADPDYRAPAEARVRFVDASVVPTLCGLPGEPIIACVNDIGGDTITMPNPCAAEFIGEDYAAVLCHEKGHILGWRHEMPSFYPKAEVK